MPDWRGCWNPVAYMFIPLSSASWPAVACRRGMQYSICLAQCPDTTALFDGGRVARFDTESARTTMRETLARIKRWDGATAWCLCGVALTAKSLGPRLRGDDKTLACQSFFVHNATLARMPPDPMAGYLLPVGGEGVSSFLRCRVACASTSTIRRSTSCHAAKTTGYSSGSYCISVECSPCPQCRRGSIEVFRSI